MTLCDVIVRGVIGIGAMHGSYVFRWFQFQDLVVKIFLFKLSHSYKLGSYENK